jgi:starch phosphorylase
LTPLFSANRAVCEYTEQLYLPAAITYRKRAENKGADGGQIVGWQHKVEQRWAAVRFGEVKIETKGNQHVFEVQVYLNGLDPKAVRVELYADGVMGSAPARQEMKLTRQPAAADGGYGYRAQVPASRPPADYTARVIPYYDGVSVPLEGGHILWQR